MKFENTMVTNFENAILGARNPMESHKRMDSFYNKTENIFSVQTIWDSCSVF